MRQIAMAIFFASLLMGCSLVQEVKPWEKDTLSRPLMQFEGLHAEVNKFETHVYFSKEASRGGSGVAGGGCGCN